MPSARNGARGDQYVEIQVVVFLVASIASLGIIRPIARRHLRTPARIRTGAAALIGTRATVLERVDAHSGQVKIGGEIWTARPFDEDDVFEPGARVDVMKIEGATPHKNHAWNVANLAALGAPIGLLIFSEAGDPNIYSRASAIRTAKVR